MINLVFLTNQFYQDFACCSEILEKRNRPHVQVQILLNNNIFCIPMRSHINHPHVLWTDKKNRCGLDFSKTVVIADAQKYIDFTTKVYIRPNEFNQLRGKEQIIQSRLKNYIAAYKKAKSRPEIPRHQTLLKHSSLQYFEEYI